MAPPGYGMPHVMYGGSHSAAQEWNHLNLSGQMERLHVGRRRGKKPASQGNPTQPRGPVVEEKIRRTIYIGNINVSASEAQIAELFLTAGPISDVRMCGDSGSKFAFIEFNSVDTVMLALDLNGRMFCGSALKVLQSKTAILSINKDLVPRSQDDIDRCKRTVYVANVDKRIDSADVRRFFEGTCGTISNLRLLGDNVHATKIAFVEFMSSDGAMAALNCSGAVLGSLAIRISPSKTPLRPEPSSPLPQGETSTPASEDVKEQP